MENNTVNTTMIKLNHTNWLLWKPKMEDILYCKDLYDPIEGDEAWPKDMSDPDWKNIHRKVIGHIRPVDNTIFHNVSNKTDANTVWKNLEARYG